MIYTEHCILHGFGFERFHCYYRTFIFSNLFNLEKFSAIINSFSALFACSPSFSYFIATVSLVNFCPCFRGSEGDRSPPESPVIYHLL